MIVVITGQVGINKKPLAARAAELAKEDGFDWLVFNVGEMMYAEAPDVGKGRILDLPLSRLQSLRRSVFKDIITACQSGQNVLINTHATFRWRHGLFCAVDYDQMEALNADLYITVVDNVDRVHGRLVKSGHTNHTLKDLMVWREEEILATELLSQIAIGPGHYYILARGESDEAARVLEQLAFQTGTKQAYLSFPMSHAENLTNVQHEISAFRQRMKSIFICFDPGDMEEKYLSNLALQAASQGIKSIEIGSGDNCTRVETNELLDIIPDIDGQLYARDFKLIDQADMIISLIPKLADGRPGLSSGVERELQHAHEATRETYIIWLPSMEPSPFITETATRIFRSCDEAVEFFTSNGYSPHPAAGTLFNNDQYIQ